MTGNYSLSEATEDATDVSFDWMTELLEVIKSGQPSADECAWELYSRGAVEAIPQLVELLEHPNARVVAGALCALGYFESPLMYPRVLELLSHSDVYVLEEAISATLSLLRGGPPPRPANHLRGNLAATTQAIDCLTPLLNHADAHTVYYAAKALGLLRATSVIPRLIELLGHERSLVIGQAANSLAFLRATDAKHRLISLLRHHDSHVVRQCVYALSMLDAREAVPSLKALLNSTDAQVVTAVVNTLQKWGEIDILQQAVPSVAASFRETEDRDDRLILSTLPLVLPPDCHDLLRYLEFTLDPLEDRRRTSIPKVFELPAIQTIVSSVVKERCRPGAVKADLHCAIESEFWMEAAKDPLFCTSHERISRDLFHNVRKRLSGIAHRLVRSEHTSAYGKKTSNGVQQVIWQNTNHSDELFQSTAKKTDAFGSILLEEILDALERARNRGVLSARQIRLADLIIVRMHSIAEASQSLGVSTKTVRRDLVHLCARINSLRLS